ncbi:uncharacterized protein LOC122083556 isoform X2 [Macadamia integrifolia]|uniref:uncharacterized protein LOC122083556 isoform X2 n=1 Tax=Macadamia integrifolia TaxID=60698 RepID=UPI001C501E2A|nr:uncharacterized protein LOC122083556 isoform X2 [Macadamia integrifolia]
MESISGAAEITELFAKLATHLQSELPSTGNEEACDPSICSLNQSLNLDDVSRVRVLNTALSLMCFKAPQTIVTVLSSSISCKVLNFQRHEFLQVGSSIPGHKCSELMRVCVDVLGKLEGHAMLPHLLLHGVLRVATSASCYRSLLPFEHVFSVKASNKRDIPVSELQHLMTKDISVNSHEIPLGLLLWYLNPLSLRHDISRVLQETVRRPFLSVNKELHDRMNWRSLIICLVLSPGMFIETRCLLHNWFLATGLASVLELQVALVSSILDLLARPMWWGISMEVGSKLPSSHAYFPSEHNLLVILTGPLSCKSFLHLIYLIMDLFPGSKSKKYRDPTDMKIATALGLQTARKVDMTNRKSIWAMLMDFPCWFYFAAGLLFTGKDCQESFLSKCTSIADNEQTHDGEAHSAAAARYLAWILTPINEDHIDLLVKCLTETSRSWALKQLGSGTHNNDTVGCKKRLKKPKFHANHNDHTGSKKYDGQTIGLWLKEFHESCASYWIKTVNSCASSDVKAPHAFNLQKNCLFRRIPLGILMGYSDYLDEEGCELLLHYAANGEILWSVETKTTRCKYTNKKIEAHGGNEGSIRCSEEIGKWKEAVAGASLVFNLFDLIEDISTSIFEIEERCLEFICQLKFKAVKYLVKCLKDLLQFKTDENEGGVLILMDLHSRLSWWRHQVPGILQGDSALDDVVSALNCKISSF